MPGKLFGDHSGHLAADRFGGSGKLDNLVSQLSKVNQSDYKILENKWADAIQNGEEVSVDVEVLYEGEDMRPTGFVVHWMEGKKKFDTEISNK